MLLDFARWLGGTEFSVWLRLGGYGVQGLQTVHILALAAVLGGAFLLDARLVGAVKSADTAAHLARRFLPAQWIGFAVLLVSGLLLITVEPDLLFNRTLRLKLMLIVVVAAVTVAIAAALRQETLLREMTRGRRMLLGGLGGLSLLLLVAIGFAGRFVAYAG